MAERFLPPNPITVRVTRRFSVPAERVYDAWLDPTKVNGWMFGPALRDEEVLRIAIDARVGGAFSFLVRRQGHDLDHVGTYLELDRPRRLVFTWAIQDDSGDAPSRVAIDIAALGDGCELVLVHEMDPKWAEYAARTQAGWTTMLEALARALGDGRKATP